MGNSKGIRFSVDVQIAACQMYMGNPSITQQEVCDHFGMERTALNRWLRKHGFSLKVAKRLPMPTKADRVARNFKVLKTEHNKVKAELMQLKQAQKNDNAWLSGKLNDFAKAIINKSMGDGSN
jgi:phage antirepressor YoqD-like protein